MSIWGNQQNIPRADSKTSELDQDDSLIDSVLDDFEEEFGKQEEDTSVPEPVSEIVEVKKTTKTPTNPTPQIKSTTAPKTPFAQNSAEPKDAPVNIAQKRLERIESRIKQLDEKKPEYIEERMALENKRSFITQEQRDPTSVPVGKTPRTNDAQMSEKEKQKRAVEELLNKKMFSYIAPVPTPGEEEEKRLKKAQEAAEVDGEIIQTKAQPKEESVGKAFANEDSSPDSRYAKAAEIRNIFIDTLLNTPKVEWYKNPSHNRDNVNQQVLVLSELLSGKKTTDVDMNDIQTARLFLFNNAPKEILDHPAFSYVESFYDYQNDQGFSGKDVSGIKVDVTQKVASPYMSAQPEHIEDGAVQSPITVSTPQRNPRVASPFINLNNTKKKGEDDVDFSI